MKDLLKSGPDPLLARVGEIVERAIADPDGDREVGGRYQVVPLDGEAGFKIPVAIEHTGPSAWTQNQRYATSAAIRTQPPTTDDLAQAEA